MNIISINFRNLFTIGLISMLGSALVRFAESKTGIDIDRDGVVAEFDVPGFGGDARGKRGRRRK